MYNLGDMFLYCFGKSIYILKYENGEFILKELNGDGYLSVSSDSV